MHGAPVSRNIIQPPGPRPCKDEPVENATVLSAEEAARLLSMAIGTRANRRSSAAPSATSPSPTEPPISSIRKHGRASAIPGTAGSSSSSHGAAATRSHGSSPARTWSNPAWCRWRNGGRNRTAPTRPTRRDGAPQAGSDEGSTRSTLPFCWIYFSLPNGLWLRVPRHGFRDSRSPPLSVICRPPALRD